MKLAQDIQQAEAAMIDGNRQSEKQINMTTAIQLIQMRVQRNILTMMKEIKHLEL